MKNSKMKMKSLCCFLAALSVVISGNLSVNAKNTEVRERLAEQSSAVQKVPYDKVLPEVLFVDKAERIWIKSLAKEDVSAAAEEMKTYGDAAFIPILRELLDVYYADAKNPDTKSIDVLKEELKGRADSIFAGYDAALEERLCMEELDYEAGKVIVAFEKYTPYEEIKEIADRMGASVDVIDGGGGKTLEDYIEAGVYEDLHFFAKFDFGISMSGPMALGILEKIDCVAAADLNSADAAERPHPGQSGNEKPAVQKVPYDKVLPEVLFVDEVELARIKELAGKDVSAAAEEMKTYGDAAFIPVLRELLDVYYADAKNPDTKSIDVLKEELKGRADSIFAGYDAALEERLCMEELDYEAGKALVVFEKYTPYEDIKEIADRMGASVDVVDGRGSKTLEDYIEAGVYEDLHFFAKFDFGISMSGPMALGILEKIDCVKALDLNGYILVDPDPDTAGEPESKHNGNEAGKVPDTPEKPHPEQNGNETKAELKEQQAKEPQAKQDLGKIQSKQTPETDRREKKSIQKGVVYTVSKLQYKVLDVERREVSLIGSSKKNLKRLNVKETVTIEGKKCKIVSVGSNAFKNRKNLNQVTLGKNIVSVGKNAFAGCASLKAVQIKSSKLKSVQKNAFWKINKKAVVCAPKNSRRLIGDY